jgi:hypothetical protein
MKIFILPYGNKAFFSYTKRVSGVDAAQLMQYDALKKSGHDVKMWAGFTDIHNYIDNVDYFRDSIPESTSVKEYEKIKRKQIEEAMFKSMIKFKPDVIFSYWVFSNSLYKKLMNFDIPLIYNSHAVPGFWSDVNSADTVSEFVERGNTLLCVSDYHASRTVDYYKSRRSDWTFTTNPVPDNFLFSSAVPKYEVQSSDGVVRHVSAASKDKDTFSIHKMLAETDIVSEVYTTLNYVTNDSKNGIYVKKNLELYNEHPRINRFDIDHAEIMENLAKSVCTFVGIAPFDSFTITSLESLSRGVPIIVKGFKGRHPAKEMLTEDMQQYVHIIESKDDAIKKVQEWSTLSLETRQAIADSCYSKCSEAAYTKRINDVVNDAVKKYENNEENTLHLDQFML